MRTFFKLIGLLVLLVVAAVAIFLATFDLDAWLSAAAKRHATELGGQIGREVTVGAIKSSLWPLFGGEVRDISVAGSCHTEEPLLEVDRLVVEARVWPAIRSLGRQIQVSSIVAHGVHLKLQRKADGSNNWDEPIVRALAGGGEEEAPGSRGAPRFERVAVEDASIELKDASAPEDAQPPTISKLLVETGGFYLGGPMELRIAAAVGAEARNFEARLGIPALAGTESGRSALLEWVELKCTELDLDAMARWAGAPLPKGARLGLLSMQLKVADPFGALGRTNVEGTAALKGARTSNADGGEGFDVALKTGLVWDAKEGLLDLGESEIKVAEMSLIGRGKIRGVAGAPSFEGLEARTDKLDLGKLRRLVPLAFASLPPGAVLTGPAELKLLGQGDAKQQSVSLLVNLDGARVLLPGTLDKPPGAALRLDADALVLGDRAELKSVKATLGELVFEGSGAVSSFASGAFSLRGGTGRFDLSRLSRLLPAVKDALAGPQRAGGVLEIDGALSWAPGKVDGKALVRFERADLVLEGATLKGSGKVEAKAAGKPGSSLAVNLDANLSGMELRFGEDMRKPAGVPFEASARLRLAGATSTAKPFEIRVGPAMVGGEATWSAATGKAHVQVKVPAFSLAELGRVLPAFAAEGLPPLKVGFSATLDGPLADMGRASLVLKGLDLDVAGQSFGGEVALKPLMPPTGKAKLHSSRLDLDRLLEAFGGEEKERSGPILPPAMREADISLEASADSGRYLKEEIKKLRVVAHLRKGWLSFEVLDLEAFGGRFTLGGTKANLAVAPLRFELKGAVEKVDAARFLLQRAGMPAPVRGNLSAGIAAKGTGLDWESAAKGLSGEIELSLADAMLPGLNLERSVLGAAAKLVPGLDVSRATAPTSLGNIKGSFRVDGGKMRLKAPLTAATSAGELGVDGAVGLDGALDMVGSLAVPPTVVGNLTAGRFVPPTPVPISLRLGGTLWAPKVTGVDASALAALALSEGMKALGLDGAEKAARDKVKKARKQAKKQADALRKKAEAEAQRVRREAEARARELRSKVEAEAKKAREEAERRARALEQKAKEEAKKLEEEAKKKAKKALGDVLKRF